MYFHVSWCILCTPVSQVMMLVCGVLFLGVGEYLKSKDPNIQVVLADPQVSRAMYEVYELNLL